MRLGTATTREAAEALADRPLALVVPVGSTEQHGPHLPLATDTMVAEAVAAGLAERRTDCAVAPAVAYGASGEHAGFAGTLSIGTEALEHLLVELTRSADGFAAVVLVSGHGGNRAALLGATRRARSEGRDALAWWPRLEGPDCDAHAGGTETSLMLAIAPETVRLELAERGDTRPLAELWPRLVAGGLRSVSRNGVLGDPTAATAQAGRALLADLVDDLERAVSGLLDGAPGRAQAGERAAQRAGQPAPAGERAGGRA